MNDPQLANLYPGGADALARGLSLACNPQPDDSDGVAMARKIAAVLIVGRLEQAGAPADAVDEIKRQFRDIHPGMFPDALH